MAFDVGDLVVQAHWPDGYVFRVEEVHDNGTVSAQPLDPRTLEVAEQPKVKPVQVAYNGVPVFDERGDPILTEEPDFEDLEPVPVKTLYAERIFAYPES